MGRASKAIMDGMEGSAGRFASSYYIGLTVPGRRWAMGIALLAFAWAGVAGLALASYSDSLRRDQGTVRVLQADGVPFDAPVEGLIYREDNSHQTSQTFAVLKLPDDADTISGKHQVNVDVVRLPDPEVQVGDHVSVIYSQGDPDVVAPAWEVTELRLVRADQRHLTVSWWALAVSVVPLIFAVVVWVRSSPGRAVPITDPPADTASGR